MSDIFYNFDETAYNQETELKHIMFLFAANFQSMPKVFENSM